MNLDETGQRFSVAGRAARSLCLVIFAAAWTSQAMPSPAHAESGVLGRLAIDRRPTAAVDSDCPYLRLVVRSPLGPDEDYQKPLRELLSTALSRAGFVVVDDDESHNWWTSSLVLGNGSESAWSTVVRAVPEIHGGGIRFTTTLREVDGKSIPFSGMHSLRLFHRNEAPEAAMRIATEIAQDLLPAVHRRCNQAVIAATREADAELERVRTELTREMERVRRERRAGSSKSKGLELQFQQTSQRRVSAAAGNRRPLGQSSRSSQRPSPPASQSAGR